jgi:hypothetical protein
LAKSGPYRDIEEEEALKRLAERLKEQGSTEHAKWMSELSGQAGQRGEQDDGITSVSWTGSIYATATPSILVSS